VKQIANSHEKSPAQVLLRHLVQQGIIVIPKSANAKRIKENGQVAYFIQWPGYFLHIHITE
jgi:diketogulonate reductase-like aldo/keto reductase